jgi:hypothetical protein
MVVLMTDDCYETLENYSVKKITSVDWRLPTT